MPSDKDDSATSHQNRYEPRERCLNRSSGGPETFSGHSVSELNSGDSAQSFAWVYLLGLSLACGVAFALIGNYQFGAVSIGLSAAFAIGASNWRRKYAV